MAYEKQNALITNKTMDAESRKISVLNFNIFYQPSRHLRIVVKCLGKVILALWENKLRRCFRLARMWTGPIRLPLRKSKTAKCCCHARFFLGSFGKLGLRRGGLFLQSQ